MNEQFIADYRELERMGVIRAQRDVQQSTGYSEPVISLYLNKKRPISRNFKEKFYEVYGKHLNVKKDVKNEKEHEKSELHRLEVDLTGGKTAVIHYPKATLNMKDIEILKTAIGMIGMAVEGYVNNN